jgi:hypothetical protein
MGTAARAAPRSLRAYALWIAFAVVLALLPHVFRSSLALSMLTQMGYLVIICLSYNILLGQGGMLSFGHAVYAGPRLVHRRPCDERRGRRTGATAAGDGSRWSAGSPACSSRRCSATSPPRSRAPPSP